MRKEKLRQQRWPPNYIGLGTIRSVYKPLREVESSVEIIFLEDETVDFLRARLIRFSRVLHKSVDRLDIGDLLYGIRE